MNVIKINKKNRTPLYLQIYQSIIDGINNRELRDNDPLPYEEDIASYYRISRQVVRQAYNEIEKEGLLVRIRRKGTFIKLKQNFGLSYTELLNLETTLSDKGYSFRNETLLVESIFAKNSRFPHCFIDLYKYAYRIVYVSYANDQAIALNEVYVPGHYNINTQTLSHSFNIHQFIETNRIPVKNVIYGMHPKVLTNIEALTLNCKENEISTEYSLDFVDETKQSYLFCRTIVDGEYFYIRNEGPFQ